MIKKKNEHGYQNREISKKRYIGIFAAAICAVAGILFFPSTARAIGGLANSKLFVLSTETVEAGRMEMEPVFMYSTAHKSLGRNWKAQSLTGRSSSYEFAARFTAGVTSNLETGFEVPFVIATGVTSPGGDVTPGGDPRRIYGIGLGDVGWGIKWRFWELGGLSLAALGGVDIPTGEDNPPEGRIPTGSGSTVVKTGMVFTGEWGKFNLDLSAIGAADTSRSNSENRYGLSADLGVHYTIGKFMPCMELNYVLEDLPEDNAQKLSLGLGFVFEPRSWLFIVTGVQIDLAGRNTERNLAYVLSWTFIV